RDSGGSVAARVRADVLHDVERRRSGSGDRPALGRELGGRDHARKRARQGDTGHSDAPNRILKRPRVTFLTPNNGKIGHNVQSCGGFSLVRGDPCELESSLLRSSCSYSLLPERHTRNSRSTRGASAWAACPSAVTGTRGATTPPIAR